MDSKKLHDLYNEILEKDLKNYEDLVNLYGSSLKGIFPSKRKITPEDFYRKFSPSDVVRCSGIYGPLFHVEEGLGGLEITDCWGILFRGFMSLQNAIMPKKHSLRISPNQMIACSSIIFAMTWAIAEQDINYRVFFTREAFIIYPERFTLEDLGNHKSLDDNGQVRTGWKMVDETKLTGTVEKLKKPDKMGDKNLVITTESLDAWFRANANNGYWWCAMLYVLPTWEVAVLYGYARKYNLTAKEKINVYSKAERWIGVWINEPYKGDASKLADKIKNKFERFHLGDTIQRVVSKKPVVSAERVYNMMGTYYQNTTDQLYPILEDFTKRGVDTPFKTKDLLA